MGTEPFNMNTRLRAKYRSKATPKATPYSARTGPHCCNGHCARKHRKGWANLKGRGK